MTKVWLVTTGDGSDGDEMRVESIHTTKEGAEKAKATIESPRMSYAGTLYIQEANIEEWIVEE